MVASHPPYRHLRSTYYIYAFNAHGWFQWRHWLRTLLESVLARAVSEECRWQRGRSRYGTKEP